MFICLSPLISNVFIDSKEKTNNGECQSCSNTKQQTTQCTVEAGEWPAGWASLLEEVVEQVEDQLGRQRAWRSANLEWNGKWVPLTLNSTPCFRLQWSLSLGNTVSLSSLLSWTESESTQDILWDLIAAQNRMEFEHDCFTAFSFYAHRKFSQKKCSQKSFQKNLKKCISKEHFFISNSRLSN